MHDGTTPLILAARLAVEGMLEDLINSHADVNAVDDLGKRAAARPWGRARHSLAHPNPPCSPHAGKSALHWAAAVNNVEAAVVLLKHGANKDMQNNKVRGAARGRAGLAVLPPSAWPCRPRLPRPAGRGRGGAGGRPGADPPAGACVRSHPRFIRSVFAAASQAQAATAAGRVSQDSERCGGSWSVCPSPRPGPRLLSVAVPGRGWPRRHGSRQPAGPLVAGGRRG